MKCFTYMYLLNLNSKFGIIYKEDLNGDIKKKC